jgi:hypothetical protein
MKTVRQRFTGRGHPRAVVWAVALLLSLGEASGAETPPDARSQSPAGATAPAQNPPALTILKRMCDRLQAARTFTFRGQASLELPLVGGGQATFFNDFDIAVRRPDGLATHRRGDLPEVRFAFDGKTMVVHVPATGKWGTTSAPPSIDAMLPAADEQGGLNMPFDEFLVADPCAAMTAGLTAAALAPQAVVKGKKVEHVVLTSAQLNLEYWIDPSTALPVRSLVIYVDEPARRRFVADFAEWKLGPRLPDTTFALPRPKGATQVDFRDAADASR